MFREEDCCVDEPTIPPLTRLFITRETQVKNRIKQKTKIKKPRTKINNERREQWKKRNK
jgi:hypothetical protein